MSIGLPWGLALSSGINTYVPLLLVALFARYTHIVHVSPRFQWLVSDEAILLLAALALGEILAQKFPLLDNLWDFAHTLLRPMAGALAVGATLGTDRASALVVTMLLGAMLAGAAHSAKSSVRWVSTSKSFGLATPVLSFGEDATVVAGTLLSVYLPWVMLGIVLFFVVIFALIAPRLVRTLCFDLQIVAAWSKWLLGRMLHTPPPRGLRESLLELTPERLRSLSAQVVPGEEIFAALSGWKRSRGPRRCWLLLTSRRVLEVERRLFRKPRTRALAYDELVLTRERDLGLFSKLELLNRQNESWTLHLPKTQAAFGAMAIEKICELAHLSAGLTRSATSPQSSLASVGT